MAAIHDTTRVKDHRGDFPQHKSEFLIEVTDPVKQGEGVAAYVVYKVNSYLVEGSVQKKYAQVTRRFRDFSSLYDRLVDKNKGLIVPALPEKNAVQKFSMSTEFIEQRRKALQTFINKAAIHPGLKDTAELREFLQADDQTWAIEVSQWQNEASAYAGQLSSAVQWLKTLSYSAQSLVSSATGRTSANDDITEDPEYLKIREYITGLESKLGEAHRQAKHLAQREQEMSAALADFGEAADALGRFDDGALRTTLSQLHTKLSQLADKSRHRSEQLTIRLEAPLKEMSRTLKAAKKAMDGRANSLSMFAMAKSDLESKKSRVSRLESIPGTKPEKIEEANREVMVADQRLQNAQFGFKQIKDVMKDELTRVQRERALELAQLLRDFAVDQANYAAEQADVWYSFIEAVN
uniref:PX domain-containing protein n=1 Tax=Polytomella parva TaxID=51329 RepID=A0A7S0V9A4_9CHLO|mmetsp:Transcript_30612/g.55763  ORF Transcript_30612/g.55763 Transcript_30612/m.55763 type:complete len:408 (+) Transcript_30612:69-1292(+)|eukprot:CAMPEP_0175039760 /NCGR_PEP_ID=MMETSP0052_2-20121109/816_1 /TAXON_ID=51329 ORGANISM="Polytomella parva, Strain SAG 63-3" /NCGR_SAMPLE_ID=MMETSP0052_2 /ASSEMBLY_ACC=CAM_ASM_000194 /LENGTH=407 /DNA_ID=CAMNT_0016301755 /DNA_START=61 /DNA_END=1284 /DNA_ORIENTATION=-